MQNHISKKNQTNSSLITISVKFITIHYFASVTVHRRVILLEDFRLTYKYRTQHETVIIVPDTSSEWACLFSTNNITKLPPYNWSPEV